MWELDCEESWVPKNWCFWAVILEKTLESPLDCKEIQPVHSKGDQPWVFFGRTDAKAETLILWPPHAKSWLIGKDSDAGRVWGQEEKGTTEDEMAGWHHWLNGCEFEWTPDREAWGAAIHGVANSQTGLSNWTELNWTHSSILAWRIPWTGKESDMIEWLSLLLSTKNELVWKLWNYFSSFLHFYDKYLIFELSHIGMFSKILITFKFQFDNLNTFQIFIFFL